ncbi:MAG: MarR family transcriptional regulator [Caulobacter sp.]|nr:MarR family transcriptional regulator [Caulobacter sp.]
MTADVVRIRRRDAVLAALETFRRIHPAISLTSVRAFLYVAENPGINVTELGLACGLTDAGASRVARALAGPGIDRALPPSLDLLECVVSADDPRERLLWLSARGQGLVEHIEQLIAARTPITLPVLSEDEAAPLRATRSH